jgi:creatinine amidohydrolase
VKVQLAEYSWPEVVDLVANEAAVIVPVGAFEQHGQHLPLMVDWYLCSQVAIRAAEQASEAGSLTVVTPPVWTGYSPHHMDFKGTVTLEGATFTSLIANIANSLAHHGFRKILVLNGHGGNANLLRGAAQTLRFEQGVKVAVASYWDFALGEIGAWRRSGPGGINHACEMETSLMLALREDMVRMDLARDHYATRSRYSSPDLALPGTVTTANKFSELTSSGSIGAPSLADKARGEELFAKIVSAVARFLEEFEDWSSPKPAGV